uniref:Uncharacterized protein n=1 Tax=Knipowitschia caucasica TaxID=637954 RepID=A0AAV2IT69_KNICA
MVLRWLQMAVFIPVIPGVGSFQTLLVCLQERHKRRDPDSLPAAESSLKLSTAQRLTVQPAPQLPADGYMRRARALEVAAASWFGQSGHGAGRTGGERPR